MKNAPSLIGRRIAAFHAGQDAETCGATKNARSMEHFAKEKKSERSAEKCVECAKRQLNF